MANMDDILDCVKRSVEGESFDSLEDFEVRLNSILEDIVDDVYSTGRVLLKCDLEDIEDSTGVSFKR